MAYIIDIHNKPLMPCCNVIARLLLKQRKAICKQRTPFTIKLTYENTNYIQNLTLGIDTGSSKIGSAVFNTQTKQIVYSSEIEIRNDITSKMKQRSEYRRNRRNRKTRYRKPRFLNRKNSIRSNKFSPTMTSKIHSHAKEIEFVKSILPISKLIIETGTFDPYALLNPEVLTNKDLYQKGINYRFSNTRSYVLNRDNYVCQYCKGKTKDKSLHVHHIVYRSNGGSDEQDNLITLCETCHIKLHAGLIKLKLIGKYKGNLRHATQMNSIRVQLLKYYPEATETFGFVTKEHRQLQELSKKHYIDAAIIASEGNTVSFTSKVLYKKCVADGDYRQSKGSRSEQSIPTNKICGFRKFDKIKYLDKEYFIKGRMSSGYAILMDITGIKVPLKPIPKFSRILRVRARKSWLMIT